MVNGELPDGWSLDTVGNITVNFDGKRIPVKASDREKISGEYPYYGASGIIDHVNEFIFDGDYLLIAEDGANLLSRSTPIAFSAHGKFWVNNHAHIVQTKDLCLSKFLEYYLNSIDLKFYVTGTAQPKLTQNNLNKIPVPIPPLPEQERIVAKIEELFTQLEAGTSALAKVQAGLRRYKASVLKAAVEGKLLNDEGRTSEEWRNVSLSEITSQIKDADHKMPKAAESDIPYVSTKDFIDDEEIDFDNAKHISKEDFQALTRKIKPEFDDILLSRYGTVGQVRKVKTKRPFQASYSIAIIKPLSNEVITDYLITLLRSELGQQQMRENIRASSQPDLGLESIRKFTFPLPPLEEQRRIVAEVERRLSVAREVESAVEGALVRASRLRQAVLKAAFEGKL